MRYTYMYFNLLDLIFSQKNKWLNIYTTLFQLQTSMADYLSSQKQEPFVLFSQFNSYYEGLDSVQLNARIDQKTTLTFCHAQYNI
jgi:hypothetical protein